MIRKFRTVSRSQAVLAVVLTAILAGAAAQAQQDPTPTPSSETQPPAQTQQPATQQPEQAQPPAQTQQPTTQQPEQAQPPAQTQQPSDQQSSSQETSDQIGMGKKKAKEYEKWDFNVGGGASLTRGTTEQFIRSGGGVAAAGVARNASRYLGLRLDFQYDALPIRSSALQSAGSTGGHAQVYTAMIGPVINVPVSRNWGGYIIGGFAYFHRTGTLDNSTAIPGYPCNPFFTWWGHCFNGNLPIHGQFLRASQNEIGEHFGGGVYRKITPKFEIYAEWRLLHGSHGGITTDLRPITAGIRW